MPTKILCLLFDILLEGNNQVEDLEMSVCWRRMTWWIRSGKIHFYYHHSLISHHEIKPLSLMELRGKYLHVSGLPMKGGGSA